MFHHKKKGITFFFSLAWATFFFSSQAMVVYTQKEGPITHYFGDGAQKRMLEQGAAKGHTLFVKRALPDPEKKYAKPRVRFASYADLQQFIRFTWRCTPTKERCFYEIVPPDRPVRFYIVVRWNVSLACEPIEAVDAGHGHMMHVITTVIECVKELLKKDITMTRVLSTWLNEERVDMVVSYQLTADSLWFETLEQLKFFVKKVLLPRLKIPQGIAIDTMVYARNQLLPMHGNYIDDVRRTDLLEEGDVLLSSLVTVPPPENAVIITKKSIDALLAKPSKRKRNDDGDNVESDPEQDNDLFDQYKPAEREHVPPDHKEVIRKLQAMLAKHGDTSSIVGAPLPEPVESPAAATTIYPCSRAKDSEPRRCPYQCVHHNSGFYLSVHKQLGRVDYHCLSGYKACTGKPALFGYLNGVPQIDTTGLHKVVKYSEKHVRPYLFDTRILMVKSGMNTGKTFALKTLIQSLPPDTRLVVVSTRIAFANTTLGNLAEYGFDIYNKKNIGPLAWTPRIVIQYESLHRLTDTGKFTAYDYVILDEAESLMNNITSKTNGRNLDANSKVFCMLITSPKSRIIALDADLSDRTANCLKKLAGSENITLHINTFKALDRTLVIHRKKNKWLELLKRDLLAGKRLMIAVTSRSLAVNYIRPFLEKHGILFKEYFNTSTDSCMLDFQNLPEEWQKYQAIVFTPRVTVGADFAVEGYFDRIYAYGTFRSCVPRTLLQMCGRCRYPKDITIHMCIQGGEQAELSTIDDVATERTIHAGIVGTFMERTNEWVVKHEPVDEWIEEISRRNQLEATLSHENYANQMYQLAIDKQYTVLFDDGKDLDLGELPDAPPEDVAAKFDAAPLLEAYEAEEIQKKIEAGPQKTYDDDIECATAEDKWNLEVFSYRAKFTTPVTGAHYVAVEPHLDRIKHLCLTAMAAREVDRADLRKFGYTLPSELRLDSEKLIMLRAIATQLGMTDILDTSTDITRARILTIVPFLHSEGLLDKIKAEFNLSRSHPVTDFRQTVGLLNTLFGHWHSGRLKVVRSKWVVLENGRRREEQVYRLTFDEVHANKTLPEIAQTSNRWPEQVTVAPHD
jgi:hypothetical protein